MQKKQFKTESKRLMDLMINSIYTNKEIFLRELISNASDAIDKLHYKSLTDDKVKIDSTNFSINISIDKDKRILTISDNGCGMTKEELENNLGTIAKSGSLAFKEENKKEDNIDIIGQFGVGFYSAFMICNEIEVVSRSYGEKCANIWKSSGIDGYTIENGKRDTFGTDIILKIKEDDDNYNYSDFLDEFKIKSLVKKYSNYITYPIKMEVSHKHLKEGSEDEYETVFEEETLNDMVPLWKRDKNNIKEDDYNTFYSDKFFDYEKPLSVIHTKGEGLISYNSLIFIPSHAPYDFYTKNYEKGLQLFVNGVLIMEKCSSLLPDYYSFVKGVVDSPDLSLNISREILQEDKNLKVIAKNIETKITKELENMLKNDREKYEEFFKNFGMQLKYGTYDNFGINKDKLKDLLLFTSSRERKLVTLKEYVDNLVDGQDKIYYASGESIDKIDMLPQVEKVRDKGYEILYLSDYIDEFVLQILNKYNDLEFINVSKENLDLDTEEEKESLKKKNEDSKDMLEIMKEAIGDVKEVRFTHRLKNHPVCLVSDGELSIEMEKVINAMPTDDKVSATKVLEINDSHKIADKLDNLYKNNKEELKKYSKILYAQARLIEGLPIENPTELANLICEELA